MVKGERGPAWFYVNDGSITVVCGSTCTQARLTRKQLLAVIRAMRKRRPSQTGDDSTGQGFGSVMRIKT